MPQKNDIPVDPDFGPNDAQLPFHDGSSNGAEPRNAAEGQTRPGSAGRAPHTETPERPDAVSDAKFLSDQFDMHPGKAADLATTERDDDADPVRDEVIARQKEEQDPRLEGAPLPEHPDEEPDQPNSMKKPLLDRTGNDHEGAG